MSPVFANGAVTAAMQHLFNAESSFQRYLEHSWYSFKKPFTDFNEFLYQGLRSLESFPGANTVAGTFKLSMLFGVRATQGVMKGTSIPKSFVLAVDEASFWVHPNATKHMAEYLTRNGLTHSTSVGSQSMLASLRASVNQAVSQGINYGQMMQVGRWELIFSAGRATDDLPVIKHALYK